MARQVREGPRGRSRSGSRASRDTPPRSAGPRCRREWSCRRRPSPPGGTICASGPGRAGRPLTRTGDTAAADPGRGLSMRERRPESPAPGRRGLRSLNRTFQRAWPGNPAAGLQSAGWSPPMSRPWGTVDGKGGSRGCRPRGQPRSAARQPQGLVDARGLGQRGGRRGTARGRRGPRKTGRSIPEPLQKKVRVVLPAGPAIELRHITIWPAWRPGRRATAGRLGQLEEPERVPRRGGIDDKPRVGPPLHQDAISSNAMTWFSPGIERSRSCVTSSLSRNVPRRATSRRRRAWASLNFRKHSPASISRSSRFAGGGWPAIESASEWAGSIETKTVGPALRGQGHRGRCRAGGLARAALAAERSSSGPASAETRGVGLPAGRERGLRRRGRVVTPPSPSRASSSSRRPRSSAPGR